MKYAVQFGFMSVAALLAARFGVTAAAGRVALGWAAASFAVVAVAYALERPRLLMKRDDGTQPVLAWVLLWPYFLLARLSFLLYRLSHRDKVHIAEVAPRVWFGRRLTGREMRESSVRWSGVLDLAAEFPRVAPIGVAYRALPMLDGAAPSEVQLRDAAEWIDERATRGDVLVHCALGHGRTGSVIVTWMLLRGHVPDVTAGVARLHALRSTFGMSRAQVERVERVAANRPTS